jgi:hypothetical protein
MVEQISFYHCRPIYGTDGKVKGMALATFVGLAKANAFLHLTVD